ncbi:MAG: hypothetical protein ABIZ05_09520 [Pseudonocardiaceae bacterium]
MTLDVVEDVGVAARGGDAQRVPPMLGESWLLGDLQQRAHGPDRGVAVLLGGEVAVQDVRLGRGQQGAEEHLAAAGGP